MYWNFQYSMPFLILKGLTLTWDVLKYDERYNVVIAVYPININMRCIEIEKSYQKKVDKKD